MAHVCTVLLALAASQKLVPYLTRVMSLSVNLQDCFCVSGVSVCVCVCAQRSIFVQFIFLLCRLTIARRVVKTVCICRLQRIVFPLV